MRAKEVELERVKEKLRLLVAERKAQVRVAGDLLRGLGQQTPGNAKQRPLPVPSTPAKPKQSVCISLDTYRYISIRYIHAF